MTKLTKDEIEKLFDAAKHNDRHLAFFMLAYYHGMRRGEILALKGTDVKQGNIHIVRLKKRSPFGGGEPATQPLIDRERPLIEKLATAAGSERMFPWKGPAVSNMTRGYMERLGLYAGRYKHSLHSLRHACGTNIYRATKDLFAVKTYLGHSSIQSSAIYVHLDEREVHEVAAKAL